MKLVSKWLALFFIIIGFVFPRGEKDNQKVEERKTKSKYYIVKDFSKENQNAQLDRKRVHKRRRKIRKPVKGLR